MKVIITKPLEKTSKEVVKTTLETISFYLERILEQRLSYEKRAANYHSIGYYISEIWRRKEFLEEIYNVKIVKD